MKKVCWMDVETTGLSAYKNDIIQLALITEVGKEEVGRKVWNIQPFSYTEISQEALDVNGLTIEKIKGFQKPQEAFLEVKEFLGKWVKKFDKTDKYHPAGFNVHFDVEFLKGFFRKNGDTYFGSWFWYKPIDPISLLHMLDGRDILSLKSYKLVDCCKHFGVPHTAAHTAMSDIEATKNLMEFLGFCLSIDTETLEGGYEQFRKRGGTS